MNNSVNGSVRLWLRAEGLAMLLMALLLYAKGGYGWGRFAALLLVPDLSLLAYLIGPRAGAMTYNIVHSDIGPLALGATTLLGLVPAVALPLALIWGAHVGMDRAVGYGLKYQTAFGDTHLGRVGKQAQPARAPAAA